MFHQLHALMLRVPLLTCVLIRTPDTIYCDSYYCPEHYSLKDDADDIKCNYSGCTTDKCCKYHCESYSITKYVGSVEVSNTCSIPSSIQDDIILVVHILLLLPLAKCKVNTEYFFVLACWGTSHREDANLWMASVVTMTPSALSERASV